MNYEGIYYIEMGLNQEVKNRSLAWGLKVLEEKTDHNWGYVIFQDILEQRQRIVSLVEKPKIATDALIDCVSDIGETFRFTYLDHTVWTEKAHQFLKIPPEIAKKLTTTQAVQNFFKGS